VGKSGALYLIDFGSASIVTYDTEKVLSPAFPSFAASSVGAHF